MSLARVGSQKDEGKKNAEVIKLDPSLEKFFENLPELITPKTVEEVFGPKIKTIYDWRYRGKLRNVPDGLFLKFNRMLYIRTEVLKKWILSQNLSGL